MSNHQKLSSNDFSCVLYNLRILSMQHIVTHTALENKQKSEV